MTSPLTLPPAFLPLHGKPVPLDIAGGKGANLVRLANAGFRIPNGFVIPTSAYRAYVNRNDLNPCIQNALHDLDPGSPEALNTASDTIRTAFSGGEMSASLANALETGWLWLGAKPVAVRSSATAEDLPELSFAGQQDTTLNVVSSEALLQAVINCWSSLWTARAIGYRARNNIPHQDVALAVVVQAMLQPKASGVLFSANPLNGKRNEIVIDATLGLGEALVGGQVEPDHYVVELTADASKPSICGEFVLREASLGAKSLILRANPAGGLVRSEIDASREQAITNEAILNLARIGKDIEAFFGAPQDVEWAWQSSAAKGDETPAMPDQGDLFILQSRPITSLFPLPANISSDPVQLMIGLHVVQGILEPITPLGRDTLMIALTGGGRLFGLTHTIETQTAFKIAAERIWINVTPILRTPQGHRAFPKVIQSIDPGVALAASQLVTDPRLQPQKHGLSMRAMRRLLRFAIPMAGRVVHSLWSPERKAREALSAFDNKVAETQSRQQTSGNMWADFSQRLQLLHEAEFIFSDLAIPKGIPPVIASMIAFFGILARFSHEVAQSSKDDRFYTIHLEIARGLPNNVTTEMDLKLWQTAQALRDDPESFEAFTQGEPPQLAADLAAGTLPPQADRVIREFLMQYGMRGPGEIDIGRARWREDPLPLIQVLQSYLQIDDPELAPDQVFARGAEAADAAAATLIAAVRQLPGGWLKSRLVRFGVSRYRAIAGLREAPKFFAIRMMGIIRTGILASGAEFVKAGVLEQTDDLFFLHLRELDEIAKTRAIPSDLISRIHERRELRARELRRKQIPRVLLSDGTTFYEGLSASDENSDSMFGDPVSPGIVEGVARVVHNPINAQLNPGEILICPGTDPAWTPLFLTAGGLVMEVGGMMTHGSVVAREYGIPAVVGVHQATTRLLTGKRIRVNGSTGRIEILDDQ